MHSRVAYSCVGIARATSSVCRTNWPGQRYAQCSTVQYRMVQCSAVQCSAVQCSAVQCSAVQCRTEHAHIWFDCNKNVLEGF